MLWLYFSCLFNLLALMNAQVLFTYKSNAVLTCTDVTSPTFYKRDSSGQVTSITSDGSKYSISANVLTILKVRKADVGYTYYCNGTAGNPVSFVNQVAPYLYQVDSTIVSTTEDYSTQLACYAIVGDTNGLVWSWSKDGAVVSANSRISFTDTGNRSQITIQNALLSDKGSYVCSVANAYGSHTRTTTLRVKSKLAPLWPFLGMCGELGVLALFLYGNYLMKKKKTTAKPMNSETPAVNGSAKTENETRKDI